MWIELAIVGVIFFTILGLFIYAKVLRFKVKEANTEAQAATETAKAAEKVIEQTEKTVTAVSAAEKELNVKHKAAQANIDAGRRDDFDTEEF